MKPKRTLEEATRLYKIANENSKFHGYLADLQGDVRESEARFESLNLLGKTRALIVGVGGLNVIGAEVLLPATMNTCMDCGVTIGRMMYEELPKELEELAGKTYVN